MDESFVSFSERLPVGVIQLDAGIVFLEIPSGLKTIVYSMSFPPFSVVSSPRKVTKYKFMKK